MCEAEGGREEKKAPLTSKAQLLEGRVLSQCLGQLRRSLVPDFIICATSQETEFGMSIREVVVCEAEGRRRRILLQSRLSSLRVEFSRSASANFPAPSSPILLPAQHHKRLNLGCLKGASCRVRGRRRKGGEEGSSYIQGSAP